MTQESFSYQFVLFINSSNITSVPERLSLCITVLQIIKEAQQQHGLRHGDFQRYRYIFYFRKKTTTPVDVSVCDDMDLYTMDWPTAF